MNSNATIDTSYNSEYSFEAAVCYEKLSREFEKYHQDPINVALHFVTTPLGVIGAFSLLNKYTKSSSPMLTLTAAYLLSLLPILPSGEFVGTLFLSAVIILVTKRLELGYRLSLLCIVLGYAFQDLAHLATGELTFQSTYSGGGQVIDFTTEAIHFVTF